MRLYIIKIEPLRLLDSLGWKHIIHIYREFNKKVDELSKEALTLQLGTFVQTKMMDGQIRDSMAFKL